MCPNSFYTLNFLGIRGCSSKQRQRRLLKGVGLRLQYRKMLPFAALYYSKSPFRDHLMTRCWRGGDGWGPPHTHTDGCGDPASDGKASRGTEVRPLSQVSQSRNGRPWTPIQPSWCPSLSARLDHRPPHHSPLFPEHLGPWPCQAP